MIKELDRLLVIPDVHTPFHDKKAWDCTIKAGKRFGPSKIIVLGDLVDFYSVSAHDKDPHRKVSLREELEAGKACLDELNTLGAEEKHFDSGNHEYRLDRYLAQKAPELADLVSVPQALDLKAKGWQFHKYGTHSNIGKLHHTHDIGFSGKFAVHHTGAAFQRSVVFGHTHRLGVNYFGSVDGKRHFSASLGWLGDASKADYISQAMKAEWQLGFGLVRVEKGGNIHLQLIPIVDGRCVIEGKLV